MNDTQIFVKGPKGGFTIGLLFLVGPGGSRSVQYSKKEGGQSFFSTVMVIFSRSEFCQPGHLPGQPEQQGGRRCGHLRGRAVLVAVHRSHGQHGDRLPTEVRDVSGWEEQLRHDPEETEHGQQDHDIPRGRSRRRRPLHCGRPPLRAVPPEENEAQIIVVQW